MKIKALFLTIICSLFLFSCVEQRTEEERMLESEGIKRVKIQKVEVHFYIIKDEFGEDFIVTDIPELDIITFSQIDLTGDKSISDNKQDYLKSYVSSYKLDQQIPVLYEITSEEPTIKRVERTKGDTTKATVP